MARFLPVFLLLFTFTMISVLQSAENPNTTDLTALIDFKNRITDDPLGVMASWNDSTNCCNWKGITRDPSNQRVGIINLTSQKLVGSLPPSLSNLTFLQAIYLRFNSFHGGIPHQLGLLSNLKHLNLANNMLSGSIPSSLGNCTELTILGLDYNRLSGKIPNQFTSLPNLEMFGVGINNMTGTFPVWIGNLSSRFSRLSLAFNSFHGGIPAQIGRLSGIKFFQVSANRFSGELPPSIYNLSSLDYFSVAQNRLQGRIPQDVGLRFPNLEFFSFGENDFTGEIPISLANASRLSVIELSLNSLKGSVPLVLGRLPFLYWLSLEQNLLGNGETRDMSFISSLTNCTNLRVLGLLSNKFGGELPNTVANLSRKLEALTLGGNQLHGSLPFGIGSFQNLTFLSLEVNFFTGSIPFDFGYLRKLNRLLLHMNEINGIIPSSLGNLTSLIQLYVNSNKLQGNLPPHLGNCTSLLELNLSSNDLTGSIPKEIMSLSSLSVVLDLSRNLFSGLLPVEVGSLVSLKELKVSGNKLSGAIPSSLSSCLSLESLIMGGNRFEGVIPNSLEALRGLEEIDFSHNNLSGKIPEFLGKLPFITKLDLSYNNLEGEMLNDGIFSNATAVSVVGNDELCGGAPSLNLSSCSIPARKSNKNHKLRWIIPLIVSLTLAIVLMCSLGTWYVLRKPQKLDVTALSTKEMQAVSYQELYRSTNGFSSDNLIGSGSFGSVYKGILGEGGVPVAVKVLNLDQRGASKSFVDECAVLKSTRHRNLLKIITVCSSFDNLGHEFKCLVTEFMVNGSLDARLHPSYNSSNTLSFMGRLSIAIDVASALEYLHNRSPTRVIHCDLKPSNILLDQDFTAHVADFGLSKFILEDPNAPLPYHSLSLQLKGSIGYIPPEYGTRAQISTMGDVYSFGVMLLELFTGKRPTDDMFENGVSVHEHVAMALPEHVMDVVDPALILPNEEEREMHERKGGDARREYWERLVSILEIGVSCSEPAPKDRALIGVVLNRLHSIREQIRTAT